MACDEHFAEILHNRQIATLLSSRCGAPHAISLVKTPHRVLRPLRTILFGGLGLGLRVGVLGVVSVWVRVRVSIRVRVGAALVRG